MTTAPHVQHQGIMTGRTLPIFQVSGDQQFCQLGMKANWGDLEDLLKPVASDDFWVESPEEDAFVDDVRGQFDRSKDSSNGYGVVHYMLTNLGGDNGDLLKHLLSLGIDPDLPSKDNWRPSHICGSYARPYSAAAIAACRPDTSQKNQNFDTPLQAARGSHYHNDETRVPHAKQCRPKVAKTFEELENSGPSTVAELAYLQKWWAVKNLARRKVIPEDEMFQRFLGWDAIEWAKYHGKDGMARELQYYFVTRKVLPLNQVLTAVQAKNAYFDPTKKSFGEAIAQLEPVRMLIEKKADASVGEVKQQLKSLDERSIDTMKKQEERFQEIEKTLKRFEGRVKSLEEENKGLKEENKSLKENNKSLEEKLVQKDKELERKLNKKEKEFKKLFEDLGESFSASEGKTKQEFERLEGKLEEVRETMEEAAAGMVDDLQSQQRKELKRTAKELEGDMKELEDKMDSFRSQAKKRFRGLGKELEKLREGGEGEGSSWEDDE